MTKSKNLCVAIIPARGGSKGIPRKNARLLDGKPLLSYAIRAAISAACFDHVIVTTDDEELEYLTSKFGAEILHRPPEFCGDDVGLDEVVHHAVVSFERKAGFTVGYVATIQPTSPLLSPSTIDRALQTCIRKKADTVLTVVEDTHLGWKLGNDEKMKRDYDKRVNRQYLPPHYRESGGIVVCPRKQLETGTRFGARVEAIVQDKREAIDIDDRFDWWLAEKQLQRKSIVFRVEGYDKIGLGHIYRSLTLADRMLDHDIAFVISRRSEIGIKMLRSRFYKVFVFDEPGDEIRTIAECSPNIVVNDILDTKAGYMKSLKKLGTRVVNFEDQGAGAKEAHAVINAMYGSSTKAHTGPDYVCLRDEFYSTPPIRIRKKVKSLLILFGGVDPSGLTQRVTKWLLRMKFDGEITIVTGPGFRDGSTLKQLCANRSRIKIVRDTKIISKYMSRADIAITSGGRTIFELASLGVPMLVMCQNSREQSHVVIRRSKGVIELGLGKQVSFVTFEKRLRSLMNSPDRRSAMHRALVAYKFKNGIQNVWDVILRSR